MKYDIHVKVTVDTTVQVTANSLEEAAKAGKELKITQVLPEKFVRTLNDSELDVYGVFRA